MNTIGNKSLVVNTELISVLLVEDSMPDARYVQEILPANLYVTLHAKSLGEACKKVSGQRFDVILLDLSLPDGQGLKTVHSMLECAPHVPIVVLTGLSDDDTAVNAIKVGAQDYLHKNSLTENMLTRTIRYSIERSQSQAQIRQNLERIGASEAYLNLALKASHTGVWSWEIATDTVTLDELSHQMFGLEGTIVRLKDFLNCVHADERSHIKHAIEDAINNREDYDVSFRVSLPNGKEHILASCGRGIYDESGSAIRMAGIFRDITKQILQQQDAQRLQVLEHHEDFIATLTHDLKNPLIGADRLLDLFLEGALGNLEENQIQGLKLLQESNRDMLELIKNLLEVYRYDAGATPLNLGPVDLRELINACIGSISFLASLSKVTLSGRFEDGNHNIVGDRIALQRVILNLLSNAIKFSVEGADVIISAGLRGHSYCFEVKDFGAGIQQDDLLKIFQRYAQGTHGRTILSGSGLGLYLCRRLVEAHGGEISCTSVEGQGTTFIVSLPCQPLEIHKT
ncbi:MAG: two-component system, cell cycle sensor histidine kinase and response regulator CckA [Cyanobacteriota bacterium erpe_2018_sw_21hr_WHONDRS-SW48-000092_B_bin.40]|jgi:PAS domain S-box-containing protein|nr:two-component system, cell cycle sensor histidine kinase and response regulator CckA [Cyanobacteriota bacterium erpe_2018_sw_21hr_WHONDRS-SW48-000092_B_bin.40]